MKYLAWIMGGLYILAGLNHFIAPEFYRQMMPPWIPAHDLMIALSGVAEVICGALLIVPRTRWWGAVATILLLIAIFPANLYMYMERDTTFAQFPAWALLVRLPMQLVLIGLAALFLRRPKANA